MDDHHIILIIALIILSYGYISKLLARFNISGPMAFTGLGLLLSPLGFHLTSIEINAEFVTILVEVALVLVLFADAALLDLKLLRQSWKIPARLLFIGLPITILLSVAVGYYFFPDQAILYLLLLALLLAPTDAALGKAVVSDPIVPQQIRASINVESGLNDGFVFPLVIMVVAMIVSGLSGANDSGWVWYVVKQIMFGALVGGLVGYLGAKCSIKSVEKNWIEENYQNLIPIALALFAFYLAEVFSGNGFIAAFFAGLYAGNTSKASREHIEKFAESEGELLVLISFFIFGLAFVPVSLPYVTWPIFIYAFLSLTVFRVLPVIISLLGSKLDFSSMVFIGWFGPRGIASILYVLIVANQLGGIAGFESIFAVVTVTVLMSIVAHGFSAQPLANIYAKKIKSRR